MQPAQSSIQANEPSGGPFESSGRISARVLRFMLGDRCFGILAAAVMEVSPPLDVTRLPFCSDFLSGIAPLRGEIVAVMNFAAAVGDTFEHDASKSKYIILHPLKPGESMPIAFSVERIGDVCVVDAADVIEPPTDISPCIVGIAATFSPPIEIIDHRVLAQTLSR